MEIIKQTTPKARKDHRCHWCCGKILKGNVYEYAFIVDGGDSWQWKNHIHCRSLVDKMNMFDNADDEGLTGNVFQEYIYEKYCDIYPDKKSDFEEKLNVVLEYYEIKLDGQ